MNTTHNTCSLPSELTKYLEDENSEFLIRRRAVLVPLLNGWELVCCTVEWLPSNEVIREQIRPRHYSQAVLYEDVLNETECHAFAMGLLAGFAKFGEIDVLEDQRSQRSVERVTLQNQFMSRAGNVVGLRLGISSNRAPSGPLLAVGEPYYPDVEVAARDWLPFPIYHGASDGRNGQVWFLMPETRAFFGTATMSEDGLMEVALLGSELYKLSLIVKGAYWENEEIHHIEAVVIEGRAVMNVPRNFDRLEYFLIDCDDTVYDCCRWGEILGYQKFMFSLGAELDALTRLKKALNDGEGQQVEFKPFVDLPQKLTIGGQRTKLHEVIATVVAFANAAGGCIYLGIDDDCGVTGIDRELQAWAKAPLSEETIRGYIGKLKSTIKEHIYGDVQLCIVHVQIDDCYVVEIDVASSTAKPIAINLEPTLYARTGASNRKVPPHQWKTIIEAESPWIPAFVQPLDNSGMR